MFPSKFPISKSHLGPRAADDPKGGRFVEDILNAALGSREVLRPALAPHAVAAAPITGDSRADAADVQRTSAGSTASVEPPLREEQISRALGAKRIHETHRLHQHRGVRWCRTCGGFVVEHGQFLLKPCKGHPTRAGKQTLARTGRGQYPEAGRDWPLAEGTARSSLPANF